MISLSEFVRTALREKSLTLAEVHLRSRGGISGGYVNDILNEKTVNPSVSKLKALALGLGVPEDDVFTVARGLPLDRKPDTELVRIVEKFKRLSPRRQEEALKMLDLLDDFDQPLIVRAEAEPSEPVVTNGGTWTDAAHTQDDPDKDNKIIPRRAGNSQ